SIGADDSVLRNILFDKASKHFGTPIGHDAKSQASGVDAARAYLAVILTRPDFDGAYHGSLVVRAASFSARLSADVAFVHLYRIVASDGVPLGTNHAYAEFVENLKSRLITAERELVLKLNGRLAWSLRGHKIRTPKPCRERRMARLHDSAGRDLGCRGGAKARRHQLRRGEDAAARQIGEPAGAARSDILPLPAGCNGRRDGSARLSRAHRQRGLHAGDCGRFGMTTSHEPGSPTIVAPQVLLGNHLKALKLPTFAREYEKVAMESAQDRADYPHYLLAALVYLDSLGVDPHLIEGYNYDAARFGDWLVREPPGMIHALARKEGSRKLKPIMARLKRACLLNEDADAAKARALARKILNDWDAITAFVTNPDLPPTNNDAETA